MDFLRIAALEEKVEELERKLSLLEYVDKEIAPLAVADLDIDLWGVVKNVFGDQFLGGVTPAKSEVWDRVNKAAKFMLWEDTGYGNWVTQLEHIVAGRKFYLRRLSYKELQFGNEEPDKFIVVRLLYE